MNYSKDHPFVLFIDEYSFLRSYDVKIGKTYKGEIDFVVMKDGKNVLCKSPIYYQVKRLLKESLVPLTVISNL